MENKLVWGVKKWQAKGQGSHVADFAGLGKSPLLDATY